MKKCNSCLEEKPLEFFSGNKDGKNGKRSKCKDCDLQSNKEWRNKREKRFKETDIDWSGLKVCSLCKQEKIKTEFNIRRATKDGLQTACKQCYKEKTRLWQKSGKYGLQLGDYELLKCIQNNVCGICGADNQRSSSISRFVIDHCHETNLVRGLLCSPCNKGIGLLGDSIENLNNAIEWIKNGGVYSKIVDLR